MWRSSVWPMMSSTTQKGSEMSDVKYAFAQYYKVERDRAEDCLGDIIKILDRAKREEADHLDHILARLIKHYERT